METFKSLNLSIETETKELKVNDATTLHVRTYLPTKEKGDFLNFIVTSALDETTGCFSPLRIEVYFTIAICRFYAMIQFDTEDLVHVETVYDALEVNNIPSRIMALIPEDELEFMKELVEDTVADIARYNSSAAGIINMMNINAEGLDTQLSDILNKVKDKEGLQLLSEIKNVVGKD